MTKAIWKDTVLAESEQTILVEGNRYFPPDSLRREYFRHSDAQSVCGWKGTAHYYDIAVGDDINQQAAWYYPDPKPAAANLQNYVAFWRGVRIVE